MKIGLIGNIVLDEITTLDGTITTSWGGTFYNIAVFQKLLNQSETLLPATPVGYDIWDNVMSDLSKMNRIDVSALYRSELPNNKVYLRYIDENEREERTQDILPPLEFERLRPVLDTDAILINFISGFDVSLQVLRQLRENYNGIMLMDIHSLLLGIDKKGNRFKQALPEWRDWTSNVDCVQMNLVEADNLLSVESAYSGIQELAEDMVRNAVEVVNITLGSEGSLVVCKEGENIKSSYLKPAVTEGLVDPTGCGDAYAAAFTLEYLRGSSAIKSAETANCVAGAVCTMTGVDEILSADINYLTGNIG